MFMLLYLNVDVDAKMPMRRFPNVSPITKDKSKIKYSCNDNIYFFYIFSSFGASDFSVYVSVFAIPNKVFILMMSK